MFWDILLNAIKVNQWGTIIEVWRVGFLLHNCRRYEPKGNHIYNYIK